MPATRSSVDTITALLETADALLTGGLGGDGSLTPAGCARGAAYSLRIALETAVDTTLTAREAGLGGITMRAKLLCLRHYAGPALAHRLNALWNRLSEGCKYHHDEIGPRHAQVLAWRVAVGTLVAELTAARVVVAFPRQTGM